MGAMRGVTALLAKHLNSSESLSTGNGEQVQCSSGWSRKERIMSNAPEILRATKELLVTKGWVQGRFIDESGQRCLSGALNDAGDLGRRTFTWATVDMMEAREALERAIGTHSVVAWNDADERTFEEVLAALDTAAASFATQN